MNAKAKKRKRQKERARSKEKKKELHDISGNGDNAAIASTVSSDLHTLKDVPTGFQPNKLSTVSSSSTSPSFSNRLEKSNNSPTFKPYSLPSDGKKYLTPENGSEFDRLVKEQYEGFVHVSANQVTPSNFHQRAKSALERLRDSNYYQYDVVMAGGKHSSRTFVKRTLVGNPGITYKYLGLRLFAHAWSGPGTPPLLKAIGDLNQDMIRMTLKHNSTKRRRLEQTNNGQQDDSVEGSCEYNLTLINYMEPSSHTKVGFKDEAFYGMGKVSVSWHADSSLEPYSSIGVYHCLPTQKKSKWDWRIALRRTPEGNDSGGNLNEGLNSSQQSIPPIVVPTKDGDAYFLNGTFNHTHQHCVLAGSEATRISSTHRVAVTKEDTYDYISKRVRRALKRFKEQLQIEDVGQMSAADIAKCQQTLTEVEMEWIAQYWLQGSQHDAMHVWWQQPMKKLEAQWVTLEELTFKLYNICLNSRSSSNGTTDASHGIPRDVVSGLLSELKSRQKLRHQWDERRADKIYQRRVAEAFRPVARPDFGGTERQKRLPKDLSIAIRELSSLLAKNGKNLQAASTNKSDRHDQSTPKMNGSTNFANNATSSNQPKKKKRRLDSSVKEVNTAKEEARCLAALPSNSKHCSPSFANRPSELPEINLKKKKRKKKRKKPSSQ